MASRFVANHQEEDGSIPALDDPVPWTADAVIALVGARRGKRVVRRALGFLEENSADVDAVGTKAKVLLAWVAGGRAVHDFADRDLAAELEASQQGDGRYGAATSVFAHSLAMLALAAAKERATLHLAARWLVAAQCANGGWQVIGPPTPIEDAHCSFGYVDIDEANADTTSLAAQALAVEAGGPRAHHDPFAFLSTLRDRANGGWSYDRPTSLHSNFTSPVANANSTAMVLQAYAASGRRPPRWGVEGLVRLQGRLCGSSGGSFFYSWSDPEGDGTYVRSSRDNVAATIAAIPGLLLNALPQKSTTAMRPLPKTQSC